MRIGEALGLRHEDRGVAVDLPWESVTGVVPDVVPGSSTTGDGATRSVADIVSRSSGQAVMRRLMGTARDPFLAEEVLQDCFVKAYRVRERLDPARSPLPWLQRVTINLCYSRVSRRKALADPMPDPSNIEEGVYAD